MELSAGLQTEELESETSNSAHEAMWEEGGRANIQTQAPGMEAFNSSPPHWMCVCVRAQVCACVQVCVHDV